MGGGGGAGGAAGGSEMEFGGPGTGLVQASPLRSPGLQALGRLTVHIRHLFPFRDWTAGPLDLWLLRTAGILTVIVIDTKFTSHKINHCKVKNSFSPFAKLDNHPSLVPNITIYF